MAQNQNRTELIKAAFERGRKAVSLRPAVGQGTAITTARVINGCTCQIEDGPWKLTVDMPEKHGGENKGPNSGVIGRGALASCLTIGYVRWAAAMDIPLDSLEVEVQADYDVRGEFGVAEIAPGYTGMRYIVRVESTAPERDVMRMLVQADILSPYLDVFANPHKIDRIVEFRQTAQHNEQETMLREQEANHES